MKLRAVMNQTRRWHGLLLGLLVLAMMNLSAATNAARDSEPWPALLPGEPASTDPSVALLHQRAAGALEKLTQAAAAAEPL